MSFYELCRHMTPEDFAKEFSWCFSKQKKTGSVYDLICFFDIHLVDPESIEANLARYREQVRREIKLTGEHYNGRF